MPLTPAAFLLELLCQMLSSPVAADLFSPSVASSLRDQLMCLPPRPPARCRGNRRPSCSCRILLSCNLFPSLSFPPSFSHTKRKHKCFIFILQKAV